MAHFQKKKQINVPSRIINTIEKPIPPTPKKP